MDITSTTFGRYSLDRFDDSRELVRLSNPEGLREVDADTVALESKSRTFTKRLQECLITIVLVLQHLHLLYRYLTPFTAYDTRLSGAGVPSEILRPKISLARPYRHSVSEERLIRS